MVLEAFYSFVERRLASLACGQPAHSASPIIGPKRDLLLVVMFSLGKLASVALASGGAEV
jgi:hypothetical protein